MNLRGKFKRYNTAISQNALSDTGGRQISPTHSVSVQSSIWFVRKITKDYQMLKERQVPNKQEREKHSLG